MSNKPFVHDVLKETCRALELGGIETALTEAEYIVAHTLNISRSHLPLFFSSECTEGQIAKIRMYRSKRAERIPLQHIFGEWDFMGIPLYVDKRALIPRPETELLVERSLELLSGLKVPLNIADIGTGCGNIAVALAMRLEDVHVYASDISGEALELAVSNINRYGLCSKITLCHGNIFEGLPSGIKGSLDMIVTNPPYVAEHEFELLEPEVRLHEPALALLAGTDGFDFYRRIAEEAGEYLKPGGYIALEMGKGQCETVKGIFATHSFDVINIIKDYQGIERVAVFRNQ